MPQYRCLQRLKRIFWEVLYNESKLKVICLGVKVKLERGEDLEIILSSYTKLTIDEKQMVRDNFNNMSTL